MKKLISSFLAFVLGFVMVAKVAAADSTVIVTLPTMASSVADIVSDPSKWLFYNDETDVVDISLGSIVTGPGTPPLGTGSVQISVTGTQRRNLATYRFSGTPLSTITTMSFDTYNPSAGNGGSASRSAYLNFNADFNGTDTWQRRLVFLPSDNGAVIQNTWQTWDTINGGSALWRYSGTTWPGTAISGTTPRTWSDLLTSYPGIRVRVTDAHMGLRVGEPYADGYTENIDNFKFGTAAGTTIFDFEIYSAPSVPVITLPANGASVTQSNMVKVDWDDSTGGTYPPYTYQYESYSDAGYTGLLYSSGWLTASEIPTAGTPVGDYYLRVRAKDDSGQTTDWSNGASDPYVVHVIADIVDQDQDGIADSIDNCLAVSNASQLDTDNDGIGDVCDPFNSLPPTSKDQCKKDGWKTFDNPKFKNQGACVSYVEHHNEHGDDDDHDDDHKKDLEKWRREALEHLRKVLAELKKHKRS